MAGDKKRKRTSDLDDNATERQQLQQPPAKTQVLEKHDSRSEKRAGESEKKKGGTRRQIRSERKTKRELQSKQNALLRKQNAMAAAEAGDNSVTTAPDSIAQGQDFVSFADNGLGTTKHFDQGRSFKVQKEKRRSPRAIRKDARRQKIEDEMAKIPELNDVTSGAGTSKDRFICFVGNLPFSVTTEQIAAHFAKLQPKAIRLSTDKQTGEGRGFAFLEFDNYDKMKTCLRLYHHSVFEPGKKGTGDSDTKINTNPKTRSRKINIELTAGGGGGKSAGRKDKIKSKNKKLDKERARELKKRKHDASRKAKQERKERKAERAASGANAEPATHVAKGIQGDIHPSRLSRVQA